jgi:(2Fe-2S) ferredoxin
MHFYRAHVLCCAGTGCTSSKSLDIISNFEKYIKENQLENEVKVIKTGCFGLCAEGPIVVVYPEGTMYVRVSPADVKEIVEEHLVKGRAVQRLLAGHDKTAEVSQSLDNIEFFTRQKRIALRNCGVINPECIDEYIARDGYSALAKVLTQMTPQQVIDEVTASNLRGRGGAGFPTGRKWQFAANSKGDIKYVCCNADEGDPGAFMDRSILEGDPHSVIEAMTIAGYAIGANHGFIYIRAEYPIPSSPSFYQRILSCGSGLPGMSFLSRMPRRMQTLQRTFHGRKTRIEHLLQFLPILFRSMLAAPPPACLPVPPLNPIKKLKRKGYSFLGNNPFFVVGMFKQLLC